MSTTLTMTRKWPESVTADTDVTPLPLPYLEYTGEPRNSKVESKSSVLKIGRRSRFTKNYPMANLTWVFTQVQYYAFVEFYTTDLGLGTASFRINLRFPFNNFITEWVVRFVGEGFNARNLDGAWQVTAGIEMIGPFILPDPASLEDWAPYQTVLEENYETSDGESYEALA